MHKIEVDYDKCNGCMACYKACYVDVIRWDRDNKKPIIAYPEECATCSWCELSCPQGAITVIPVNPVFIPEPYPRSFYPKSYIDK
ncbi:MAG: ferredoxin family protein [Spirochaetes bacterium]|nr:ferredoxin family protein [Spirochaetota bacterium]